MCVTGEVYDKIPQGSSDLNNGIQWLTKPFCRAIVISIHLILSWNAQTTIAFIGIGKGVYSVGYPILGLLHTTIYLRAMHDAFMDPTGTRFSTLIYLHICNGVRKTCLQLINAFMDPLMQHHFHDFFLHMSSIYSFFTLYSMFHSIEFFQRFHTFLTSVVNLV